MHESTEIIGEEKQQQKKTWRKWFCNTRRSKSMLQ